VLHGLSPRLVPEILLAEYIHLLLRYVFPEHYRVFEPDLFQGRQNAVRQSLLAVGSRVERTRGTSQSGADDGISGSRQQHAEADDGPAREIRIEAARAGLVEWRKHPGQQPGRAYRKSAGPVGDGQP